MYSYGYIIVQYCRLYISIIIFTSSSSLWTVDFDSRNRFLNSLSSYSSSGCVRCLISRFLRVLLLIDNNKPNSSAIFLIWVAIWVEKLATQVLSRLKLSWVEIWVSCNGICVECTQIGELSTLKFWVAFIQLALVMWEENGGGRSPSLVPPRIDATDVHTLQSATQKNVAKIWNIRICCLVFTD